MLTYKARREFRLIWKNVKPSMTSEEESDPEEKTTLRRRRPLWRSEVFNDLIQDVGFTLL